MPRFSLRMVFASFTLITLGAGLAYWAAEPGYDDEYFPSATVALIAWFGGCTMAGAGLLLPFKMPDMGALLGLAFAFAGLVYFFIKLFYRDMDMG